MNGLFGLELPTPVNFVIAFVVVLALIGAATWLVRRFGATRLDAGARNRQPRLAVIDTAAVDGRRKLVIIRRDNVEHLLMIGGPTDVVVETNIVRSATAVAREAPAVRVNGGEPLPRAMPLPDTASWPLQPDPAAPARGRASGAGAHRRCRAMADAGRAGARARSAAAKRLPASPPIHRPRPPRLPRARPSRRRRRAPRRSRLPWRRPIRRPPPPTMPTSPAWRTSSKPRCAVRPRRRSPPPCQSASSPNSRRRRPAAPRPAPKPAVAVATAAPAAAQQKQPFESLEQEMASLLGRPGKT